MDLKEYLLESKQCTLANHGLKCFDKGEVTFVQFNIKKDELVLNKVTKMDQGDDKVINSQYNFNFFSSLQSHPFNPFNTNFSKYFVNAGIDGITYSQYVSKFKKQQISLENL